MAKSQSSRFETAKLLSLLEGRSCNHCSDGTLERGNFKDNRAVLCDTCETPRVQVWTVS